MIFFLQWSLPTVASNMTPRTCAACQGAKCIVNSRHPIIYSSDSSQTLRRHVLHIVLFTETLHMTWLHINYQDMRAKMKTSCRTLKGAHCSNDKVWVSVISPIHVCECVNQKCNGKREKEKKNGWSKSDPKLQAALILSLLLHFNWDILWIPTKTGSS